MPSCGARDRTSSSFKDLRNFITLSNTDSTLSIPLIHCLSKRSNLTTLQTTQTLPSSHTTHPIASHSANHPTT